MRLYQGIGADEPGWEAALDAMGRPVVMADHANAAHLGAVLLRQGNWRCVWFDPVTAVVVHQQSVPAARVPAVDFAERHFAPHGPAGPRDVRTLLASARAVCNYLGAIPPDRLYLVRPLAWAGLDDARQATVLDPGSSEAWQCLGQIELLRSPLPARAPRYNLPFDPTVDLPLVRASCALRRALDRAPEDFTTLMLLDQVYETRQMYEAALPLLERMTGVRAFNQNQARLQTLAAGAALGFRRMLGPPPPEHWRSPEELEQVIAVLLRLGRAESAAVLIERGHSPAHARWECVDRVATLWLHLGDPARARSLWEQAGTVPDRALLAARIGATYLAEADLVQARQAYQRAIARNPRLFEAQYALAVLEADAGHATAAYQCGLIAVATAADARSRAAAQEIVQEVQRSAQPAAGESHPEIATR